VRGLEQRMQQVDYLGRRLTHPGERIRVQRQHLMHLDARLKRAASHALVRSSLRLSALRHRLIAAAPDVNRLQTLHQRNAQRLTGAMQRLLQRRGDRIVGVAAHLNALSPQLILQRGYSIVSRSGGDIVHDAAQLAPGDDVTMTFARGGASATVTDTRG
jgi:exodeoxyribonuclease VII large subunit